MTHDAPLFRQTEENDGPQSAKRTTFDPSDWDAFRASAHRLVDQLIDSMRDVRDRPVWQEMPAAIRESLDVPAPRQASELEQVLDEFRTNIFPYPTGNTHPCFWGWVTGNGTPAGWIADLLISAMNCHVASANQGAADVERQVIRWIAEILGLPLTCSGLVVGGGTEANLIGLTVARNTKLGPGIRRTGLTSFREGSLRVYGSIATHAWIERANELLGLGSDCFVPIPVDSQQRILLDQLTLAIERDLSLGLIPIAIIGNAGTVQHGACDDLGGLSEIGRRFGIHFHVDGAFGAMLRFTPSYSHRVDGIELADSIAMDWHKWGSLQYETACVLIRSERDHYAAFSMEPPYLENLSGGLVKGATEFASRGIQLSRSFRALRIWIALKVHGTEQIGQVIEQNIHDVQNLVIAIDSAEDFQRLGPADLNIVCFRYHPGNGASHDLDAINQQLLIELHESGKAIISSTRIEGAFALRLAHTNHRTTPDDLSHLLENLRLLGKGILDRR